MDVDTKKIYNIGSYDIHLDLKIGVGNYTSVYLGTCNDENICKKYNLYDKTFFSQKTIKNVVAVKKICISNLSYKQKKIVSQEIEVLNFIKQFPHNNIIMCYDIINDIDTIYAITEYCGGGNLSNFINKNKDNFDEQIIKSFFRQIIKGIQYLHDNKIIHRDIKPDNVLVDDGCIKICDFGLSKIFSGLKKINSVCGSPLYMAPELFRDKCYNFAIDIWSSGVLLYELIYGINPLMKIRDYKELEQFMISTEEITIPPQNTKISVSASCIELLKIILCKESDKRITLDEIDSHFWFHEDNIQHSSSSESLDSNNNAIDNTPEDIFVMVLS